jgi:cell pole-organizing protein PopZ
MSENTAKPAAPGAGGDEPSMEDILASIRRILSEEEEEAAAAAAKPAAAAPTAAPAPAAMPAAAEPEPEPAPMVEPEPEPEMAMAMEPEPMPQEAVDPFAQDLQPAYEPEPEPMPQHRPAPPPPRAPMPEPMADVLQLTPDMITTDIMSEPTVRASTDVLAELARAILDRRDMSIGRSSKDLTLEGMVREMLKPILKEWLDRNLPYLIERLVKKEIDTMVNRAERLED